MLTELPRTPPLGERKIKRASFTGGVRAWRNRSNGVACPVGANAARSPSFCARERRVFEDDEDSRDWISRTRLVSN